MSILTRTLEKCSNGTLASEEKMSGFYRVSKGEQLLIHLMFNYLKRAILSPIFSGIKPSDLRDIKNFFKYTFTYSMSSALKLRLIKIFSNDGLISLFRIQIKTKARD